MKPWILVVETAPRTKKRRYLICRYDGLDVLDGVPKTPTYAVWAVADYFEEAVKRVDELNAPRPKEAL